MIELIDTHCHVHYNAFDSDREEVIDRASHAGVVSLIAIGAGDGIKSALDAVELADAHEGVYATVGIHPHDAASCNEEMMGQIQELAKSPRVVAIGEMGLDYFYDHSPREIQREVFRKLLRLAKEIGLPISIHNREAHKDLLEIIRSEKLGERRGVMHCFSGDLDFAKACLDLGFLISIPGIVTFKNAQALRDVVKQVRIEEMVIETDSPYLAPDPYRGKRNEPAYVVRVAEAIAQIKGLSVEDVGRITTLNARRLFRIDPQELEVKIAYSIRGSLYLNVTNKCTLACTFCPKFEDFMVKGHYLRLRRDPTFEEILEAVGDPSKYQEVVFCGYGEPTLRLDMLKQVAHWLKEKGVCVRLNTDGLGNLVHEKNILPELSKLIDIVSVSLNAHDPETYAKICRSKHGEKAYLAVKGFIREAKQHIPKVIATAVTYPGVDIERCQEIVEKELGVQFRARQYNEVG